MRVGVVYMKPRQVAYVRRTGLYRDSSVQAWDAMMTWATRNGVRQLLTCAYGLTLENSDSGSSEGCRYDACIELPAGFPPGNASALSVQTLPGGAFARVRHLGPYSEANSSVRMLREQWLAQQPNLKLDRRRPVMIIYLDDPMLRAAETLRCDVCVPVAIGCDEAAVA